MSSDQARGESGLNILIIDDEDIMRDMLKDLLSDSGYTVQAAASGEEAIERMKETDFGIVITDIRMPGMNGVEVTRKCKQLDSDACVIVITGYASIESAIAVLKEGAYDYITKPFNIDDMKIVVKRAEERQVLLKGVKEKDEYKRLSTLDGLTEIYNRRHFDEMIGTTIRQAQTLSKPLSLLMIDIDNFKGFNDTNGHLSGDWALKRIAQIIAGTVGEKGMVFRYGGEEISALLPAIPKAEALEIAQEMRRNISGAKFLDKKVMPTGHVTISIGVAVYPNEATDVEVLIGKADECLYKAKESGRDKVCFLESDGAISETR